MPDPKNPQSLNRYSYVNNRPLSLTDPSGHCGGNENDQNNPDYDCWKKLREIEATYQNVTVNPDWWSYDELTILLTSLNKIYQVFNSSKEAFAYAFGHVTFNRNVRSFLTPDADTNVFSGDVTVYNPAFRSANEGMYAIIHEMGHVFDYAGSYKYGLGSWFVPPKSRDLISRVWPAGCVMLVGKCFGDTTGTPASDYARTNSAEDFAETFATHVFRETKTVFPWGMWYPDQTRRDVVSNWIALTVQNAQ